MNFAQIALFVSSEPKGRALTTHHLDTRLLHTGSAPFDPETGTAPVSLPSMRTSTVRFENLAALDRAMTRRLAGERAITYLEHVCVRPRGGADERREDVVAVDAVDERVAAGCGDGGVKVFDSSAMGESAGFTH